MSNTNDNSTKPPSSKQKRWTFIQNDLENALNSWDELEKNEVPLSREEQQLVKIKSIINQLKDKLDQFWSVRNKPVLIGT